MSRLFCVGALLVLILAGCDQPANKDKDGHDAKSVVVGGTKLRLNLVEAEDGHQYVIASTRYDNGGVSIVHAAGCKACAKAAAATKPAEKE